VGRYGLRLAETVLSLHVCGSPIRHCCLRRTAASAIYTFFPHCGAEEGRHLKQRSDNRISFLGIAAVLVIICDIASFALLFSRLSAYAPEGFRNVIPLTESRDLTTVTESTRQELAGGDSASQLSAHDVPNVVHLASPGFRT